MANSSSQPEGSQFSLYGLLERGLDGYLRIQEQEFAEDLAQARLRQAELLEVPSVAQNIGAQQSVIDSLLTTNVEANRAVLFASIGIGVVAVVLVLTRKR